MTAASVAPAPGRVAIGRHAGAADLYLRREAQRKEPMAEVIVVYWRDIPAQVIAGRGRRAVKRALPERFEQAIDRAAMRSGAAGTDDYLAAWRKAPAVDVPGEDEAAASQTASRIETDYDAGRLKSLVERGGWTTAPEKEQG